MWSSKFDSVGLMSEEERLDRVLAAFGEALAADPKALLSDVADAVVATSANPAKERERVEFALDAGGFSEHGMRSGPVGFPPCSGHVV